MVVISMMNVNWACFSLMMNINWACLGLIVSQLESRSEFCCAGGQALEMNN